MTEKHTDLQDVRAAVDLTAEQVRAIIYLHQTHPAWASMQIRQGRHGYIEVDIWTTEIVKVYEIAPIGDMWQACSANKTTKHSRKEDQ